MRIRSVELTANEVTDRGIAPIKLKKLGKLVLLVGPNGSGKSRMLGAIASRLKRQPILRESAEAEENLERLKKARSDLEQALIAQREACGRVSPQSREGVHRKNSLRDIEQQIRVLSEQIEDSRLRVQFAKRVDVDLGGKEDTVPTFVCPADLKATIAADENYTTKQRKEAAESFELLQPLEDSNALPRLRDVLNKHFVATHPQTKLSEPEVKRARQSYERLQELIETLLGVRLDLDGEGEPAIYEKRVQDSELSNGQVVLLYLAARLEAIDVHLQDALVALDEPELYIHPRALLTVIRRLLAALSNGQLWIATHSVHLVAEALWMGPEATVIYVDDGRAEFAGEQPEKILAGLIGEPEDRDRLADLLDEPGKLEEARFATECLSHPLSAPFVRNDPQVGEVADRLPLGSRILDYGCGQARVLAELIARSPSQALVDVLDYYGFDREVDQRASDLFAIAYPEDGHRRLLTNAATLAEDIGTGSVDQVLLMNTLHEIEPVHWVECLGSGSSIERVLKAEGVLRIVEDLRMPVGELPHAVGFVLLDKSAVHQLFGDTNEASREIDVASASPEKYAGRLVSYTVPKRLLRNVNVDSVRRALEQVKNEAHAAIVRVRASKIRNGREHALFVMQYANASLALDQQLSARGTGEDAPSPIRD